jgi:lipopolysaccharide transport system ATP-binding protein
MKTNLSICAEGIGKRYRRGASKSHNSLRDALQDGIRSVFRDGGAEREREQFWALKDATFQIERGENVGIIGLNGAGKSTLLKVLSRIVTPTEGHATIAGRLGALLEVGTGFHAELTGRENIYLYGSILGMSRHEIARKFDAIVDFSEIADFIDTPVKRYSSGMYVRLAFAVAAHLDPDILLLDEVLAVGDFTFQRKCLDFARKLERKGATILFVSHNMFSIKSMCRRVIYLKRGQIVFDGPTEVGLRLYEQENRLVTAPWNDAEGAPAIEITEIKLCSSAGEERAVFDHGECMTIRIQYNATRPIQNPNVMIGFDRSDEVDCCTYSTAMDGVDILELSGEGTIELRTPPLKLVADLYTATVSVREHVHGRMVCGLLGQAFHIRHDVLTKDAFGVFNERGEWTLN